MFGLMEAMVASPSPEASTEIVRAVVPTIAVPLVAASALVSMVATALAGLFGYELRLEGPRKLLEVLLKPRVIAAAVALNAVVLGAYWGAVWVKNGPEILWRIDRVNARLAEAAASAGMSSAFAQDRAYTPVTDRENAWKRRTAAPFKGSIRQAWRTKLDKGVFGGVSVSGKSLFVGSDDGYVYELDRGDGRVLRKFYVGTEVTPKPAILGNRMYVGEGVHDTHHARLYQFDLSSGKLVKSHQTTGHVEGQTVIASFDGRTQVFAMGGKDGVHALDAATMEKRWQFVGGHTDSEVRVEGSRVFFATGIEKGSPQTIRRAYALDFATGKVLWQAELEASGWMAPVLLGPEACWGLGEIYQVSNVGYFSCFDKVTGKPTRHVKFDSPLLGIPYFSGKSVAVSSLDGTICALPWPLPSGDVAPRWCHRTGAKKTYASVSYDGAGHYVYPATDGVLVLDERTGQVAGRWSPTTSEGAWGPVYSSISVADDGWYVADLDGNVRKLSL